MAYTVQKTRIFDGATEIQLFGINLIGMEYDNVISGLWSREMTSMLDQIVTLGFNFLRLPVSPKTLQNVEVPINLSGGNTHNPKLENKRSLEILDILINEIESRGLRYVFDLHYLENGQIPSKWYTDKYPESQWLKDLVFLASHFKGRRGFVGIDTKNEPNSNQVTWGDGNNATDWKAASERAFLAINAVNPDIINIVEMPSTKIMRLAGPRSLPVPSMPEAFHLFRAVDNPINIPADKYMPSIHIYGPDVWGPYVDYFKAPNFPANLDAIYDGFFGSVGQEICVFMGEFGGKYGSGDPVDKPWQDAFVSYLMKRGVINGAYWCFGPTSYDTGGILADDGWQNVRTDKMQNLLRMKTSKATLTTDSQPIPRPEPETGKFKAGDIVYHITGEGPRMLVTGAKNGTVDLEFNNSQTGLFHSVTLLEDHVQAVKE